jgi:hypothetical protein
LYDGIDYTLASVNATKALTRQPPSTSGSRNFVSHGALASKGGVGLGEFLRPADERASVERIMRHHVDRDDGGNEDSAGQPGARLLIDAVA